MIFSPHHTTLPLTQVEPGTWVWSEFGFDILDWVFFPLLFFFFLFLFSISRSDWVSSHFCFFLPTRFSKGKLTTHDSFLHYCLPHSSELENRLTRSWQRATRLERRHSALAVLHGHGALFRVRTAMRCDTMRCDFVKLGYSDFWTEYTNSKCQIPFNSLVADWDDLRFAPRKLICTEYR